MKVFWSWQSDNAEKSGRFFVRDVLKELASKLQNWDDTDEAERPEDLGPVELDHDTKDVPGSPPIAQTILDKIDRAAVFVADVTPVGVAPSGKRLANPNVMIELGYALKSLGHSRIVLVMNEAEGATLDSLPFDLRHWRKPIQYYLSATSTKDERIEQKKKLLESLSASIKPSLVAAADQMRATDRLTNPRPQFKLELIGMAGKLETTVSQKVTELGVKSLDEIIEKKKKLSPNDPFHTPLTFGFDSLLRPHKKITNEDYDRYNESLELYFKSYARYLDEVEEYRKLQLRTLAVKLVLANIGTLPGTNIDVFLDVPDGLVVLESSKNAKIPSEPRAPTLGSVSSMGYLQPNHDLNLLRPLHGSNWISIDSENNILRFHVDNIKQHMQATSDDFLLQFLTSEDIGKKLMPFNVVVNELPEPQIGTLPFDVSHVDD